MKLYVNLSLASAAVVGLVAFAGCTGIPGSTPTPTATPTATATPTPLVRTAVQQLVIREVQFLSNGDHFIVIKNNGSAAINTDNLWISFHPTTNGNEASSTITGLTGIAGNAAFKVFLRSNATPQAGVEYKTGFADGTVQYNAGGALALFNGTATSSTTIADFVQWGRTGTKYEAIAVDAKLWKAGTTIATQSLGATGSAITVTSTAATGSTNWSFR